MTTLGVAVSVLMTPGISLPRATLILLMTIATVDLLQTRNLAGAAHRVVDVGMHRTE
jgi:ATP-binding cassette, subfamily C, bacterial CydC